LLITIVIIAVIIVAALVAISGTVLLVIWVVKKTSKSG
jgi:hypothetical protein